MLAILTEYLLEVVTDGVGIAETMTLGVSNIDGGLALILARGYILNIISGETPEALVVLIVIVVAELCLQLQVLVNLPTERTGKVQVLALLLTVIVVSRRNGVIQVTQIVIGTCRRIEIGQGNGGIDDGILQTWC